MALNGQQFTGKPVQFRYYDIRVSKLEPAIGLSEGGTLVNIVGQGLYDSTNKRVKFSTPGGERIVSGTWDRKLRCVQCIVPPLTWLFGGIEVPEEELEAIKARQIDVSITFNNQEWIAASTFKYHDWKVERVAYALNFASDIADPVEKEKAWKGPEAVEVYPSEMSEEERKKKDDEKTKKA